MMNQPEKIIIHHSGDTDGPEASWPAIRRYHMSYKINYQIVSKEEYERRLAAGEIGHFDPPYAEIAYHAGIETVDTSEILMMGRWWDWSGAHTIGENTRSLGFCFVGDYSAVEPSAEKLERGAAFINFWMRLFKIPITKIFPHRYFNQTDCPGAAFPWDKFIKLIGG